MDVNLKVEFSDKVIEFECESGNTCVIRKRAVFQLLEDISQKKIMDLLDEFNVIEIYYTLTKIQ